MNNINIESKDRKEFSAYLAMPKNAKGPGIVLAQEIFGVNQTMKEVADYYAEEGYIVLVPDLFWRLEKGLELDSVKDFERAFTLYQKFDHNQGVNDIQSSIDALRSLPGCTKKVGVLGFCLGGTLAYLSACRTNADVCVGYYGVAIDNWLEEADSIKCNLSLHLAEQDSFCPADVREKIVSKLSGRNNIELFVYPGVDHAFARKGGEHFDKPSALLAHERSIATFRKEMGPHYNFSDLWDKHCEYEFNTRNVEDTMATMVSEPYVNHIPTLTGGVGYKNLYRFYKNHFVNSNPPDTKLMPISRTVGHTQIVDELLFCFTHTIEIDWMLPGIKPTGKYVEIPLVAIVKFRGDKLYHEHIYWDQASVLVQIGVLDPKGLPVAGIETAKKLLDESLPSNELMSNWKNSESK